MTMTPKEVLGVAREWYDDQTYPTTDSMLFALLVDVAAAYEQALAQRYNIFDRPAGAPQSLADLSSPRSSMITDLVDNLEYREGDRTG